MFAVVGCGKGEIKPVTINEQNDKCEAVLDNPFTTEIILENGKALKFDDIGCMYKSMDEHKNEKIQETFVRDYHTKDWIKLHMYMINPSKRQWLIMSFLLQKRKMQTVL
nr:hypothetical protein GGBNIMDK_00003 [Bacillus cereus]WLE91164.1 hypothetical protein GGBNIMDK_00195 [Bacillus cereus]